MSTVTEEPTGSTRDEVLVRDRADVSRQIKLVAVFAVVAVLLAFLALSIDDKTVLFTLGERISKEEPAREVDGLRISWIAVAVVVAALVLAVVNKVPKGVLGALVFLLVGIAFFVGFIIWNFADQEGRALAITNPLPGTIRLATPLVLGALAGVMCERAGVINIAIEGQLLAGAFFASMAASLVAHWATVRYAETATAYSVFHDHSAAWGLLGGVLAGVFIAWMLGIFSLRYLVNQVVLGVVLIAFATGLTAFLLNQIPDDKNAMFNSPDTLERIPVPGLSEIPVLGPTLFNQTLLVYLMYVSIALVWFLLYQTRWGLRVRSVGEHPKAADTVGIKVNRVRWQAILLGGVFAGLGGAFFTVGSTGSFDNGASAGNGFIALAAVIMGRWHPIGATLAALFFGFLTTLQFQLQLVDKIPGELLLASPYLATIIAVAGFVGRVRPPAADGEPYVKS